MGVNNSRLADVGSHANRQRAGRAQAILARTAVTALQGEHPGGHRDRWIAALQHCISNPEATLAELGRWSLR